MISIVIPCFNEAQNLPLVYQEVLNLNLAEFEVIFVNDGSRDQSWDRICSLGKADPRVKGINFIRNFGQALALEAGLKVAKGKAVVIMDADLQHPPEIIPQMIQLWEEGNLVVNAIRRETKDIPFLKKITSKLFYRIFRYCSELDLSGSSPDFRLLDRQVVDFLNALPETPKFFRGLVAWSGFKNKEILFDSPARKSGESGFSISKMFDLARIGITGFSYKPLKLIIFFGIILTVVSSLLFLCAVIFKFINPLLFSSAALFGSFILANTGVIIVILGILAVYNVTIINELRSRPSYLIKQKIGFEE